MPNRGAYSSWVTFLVVAYALLPIRPVAGQVGSTPRPIGPNPRTAAAAREAFQGQAQLSLALEQAGKGEIDQSLKSARAAFAEGDKKRLYNELAILAIGPQLVSLSELWGEHKAPPDEVAAILRDVVLPPRLTGEIFSFPLRTHLASGIAVMIRQPSRVSAPESVGAELVRWSVAAKQTDELHRRLQSVIDSVVKRKSNGPSNFNATATQIVGVQLALAESNFELADGLLKEIANSLEGTTETQLDYVSHAVSVALQHSECEKSAVELLEAIAERALKLPNESTFRTNAISLLIKSAELHALAGRMEHAKRCALSALATPPGPQRYGPDNAMVQDHIHKQQAAAVLLDAGAIVEGLELAMVAPNPLLSRYSPTITPYNLAVRVGRGLQKLAPADRYQFLHAWALPSGDRTEIRSIIELVSPELFPHFRSGLLSDVYSTNVELIATARELGRLDELIEELNAIPVQTDSVTSLQTLAQVMRDGSMNQPRDSVAVPTTAKEVPARLAQLLAVTTKQVPAWEMANKPQPPLDTYAITVEAARHPEWCDLAEALMTQLIEHAQRTQAARIRDHFRLAYTELLRLKAIATSKRGLELSKSGQGAHESSIYNVWSTLRPKMWDALSFATANEREFGALPPTWFAHENYLSHVSNGQESELTFAVPLTGSFEFNADCREGGWTEGLAGYGGVSCQMYAHNDAVYITGTGGTNFQRSSKMTNLLHRSPWNHYTIQVDGETVRHFANGQLVLEDQAGTTAPWLTLGGKVGFTPTYRNLRITGSPTIPREVALLSDPRLRGWISSYFAESRPNVLPVGQIIKVEVQRNKVDSIINVEDDGTMPGEPLAARPVQTDWMITDGELRSARRSSFWSEEAASWLSYQRPLRNGDTLRYEFYYQPAKTIAHPTLGDVVYQLEEKNGTTTDKTPHLNRDADWSRRDGQLASTTLKGSAEKLINGWNTVKMSLRDGKLTIELNDSPIVSEELSLSNNRRFGFYHDAVRSDLRVRNVILSGDWPKSFEEVRAAVEMPTPTEPLPDSRFLTQVIGENYLSDNAFEIYRHAVTLETAERLKFLRHWVLPNESSDLLRISGSFTPTHPAPPVLGQHPIDVATAETRQAVDSRCVQTGGNFVCPAILLVLAAGELDQLAKLKTEILELPTANSLERSRGRAALLGIIALIEDSPDEAVLWIREAQTLAGQNKAAPMSSRWGDVALASLAIHHPATRDEAFELLEFLLKNSIHAGNPGTQEFSRFVNQLHGQCLYLKFCGEPEAFGTNPKTTQWRTVSHPRARTRGEGIPISSFDIVAGEMAQRGGHDFDAAYFQSPLLGNYEINCRLSHFDYREAMLMAAGNASSLQWTHSEMMLTHAISAIKEFPLANPITPKVYQWHDYKIVVKDGRYTSFVNGQKLYEEPLTADHDPWVAVVGWAGNSSRAARDVVITGKPTIPRELNLLGTPDLRGWMVDYYAAEWGQTPFAWKLAEDELTSPQVLDDNPLRDRRKVENIIRYHRPMLEDGEISYEFFYDPEIQIELPPRGPFANPGVVAPKRTAPGKSLVHPALDRMVCLIEPDGVKLHWLTDGRWDRTGLKAGNVESVASQTGEANKPPLKAGDWNLVKFATKEDRLTVELNGQQIFSREIEPTNLRHFGFFHYANESSVRVRNVGYRGDWPTQLPRVDQQDLASAIQKLAAIPDVNLPDSRSWDFTKSKFSLEDFRYHWNPSVAKQIIPAETGLRIVQPAGETKVQFAGISPKFTISGDFIATMDYEGLKAVPAEEGWGSGLSFRAALDGSYSTGFEVRLEAKAQAKMTRAAMSMYEPNRPNYFQTESIGDFPAAGRLRLQRHGPVLYYFTAAPKSDNFQLLTQRPLGTHDIKFLSIQGDASDKTGGAEFLLKSLSIRAAKLTKAE